MQQSREEQDRSPVEVDGNAALLHDIGASHSPSAPAQGSLVVPAAGASIATDVSSGTAEAPSSAACRTTVPVQSSSAVHPTSPSSRAARKRPLSPPPPPPAVSSSSGAASSDAWDYGQPRRLLHVFAGPGGRIDGLRQMMLELYKIDIVEVDTLIDSIEWDLTRDDVFDSLMARIAAGEFFAGIIGTPCGTFSVARIRVPGEEDDGPVQMRFRGDAEGRHSVLTEDQRQQLDMSNLLVERSVAIARALQASGGQFIVENPVTRSDPSTDRFRWRWRSGLMHRCGCIRWCSSWPLSAGRAQWIFLSACWAESSRSGLRFCTRRTSSRTCRRWAGSGALTSSMQNRRGGAVSTVSGDLLLLPPTRPQ